MIEQHFNPNLPEGGNDIEERQDRGEEEEDENIDDIKKPCVSIPREFKFLITGNEDLEVKLLEFKKVCEEHEKHVGKRRGKRRFYQMGLMAKVVTETTYDELRRMMDNGVYTFHVDSICNHPDELKEILAIMNSAIIAQREEQKLQLVTALAIEINGECCRVGRLRNNCTVMLNRGSVMTLTTNQAYRYCGFREIVYVINLRSYLPGLKLGDILVIGREVRCRIVKCLADNIAVLIIDAGLLTSYDFIELPEQCHVLNPEVYPDLYLQDLELAGNLQANFVILPKIRCKAFVSSLRDNVEHNYSFKLIGMIDFEHIRSNMLDLLGIIKLLDYLLIPDMFNISCCVYNYIMEDVLPISRCQKKPVIGTVPLERCNDFKRFESHEFLWKIDSIHIQKSPWCNKYPLIVKKLLPVRDYRVGVVQDSLTVRDIQTSFQSIVNFIIRTICTIECQAIIMHTKCENASVALGRSEIYCPVYMMLPIEPDDSEETLSCKFDLARALNLRRNLKPIIYSKDLNVCEYSPVEFGVDYLRNNSILNTGDFVVTLDVGKEDEENVTIGMGDDVVILRAFYIEPMKMCEKYKFSS